MITLMVMMSEVPVFNASSTWVESLLLRNSLTVVLFPEVSFGSSPAFFATRRMVSTSPVWPSPSEPPQLLRVVLTLPRSCKKNYAHVMTFITLHGHISVSYLITFMLTQNSRQVSLAQSQCVANIKIRVYSNSKYEPACIVCGVTNFMFFLDIKKQNKNLVSILHRSQESKRGHS